MNNVNANAKDSWGSHPNTFWSDFKGLRSTGVGATGEATIVNILVQPAPSLAKGSEDQYGLLSKANKNNWWSEPSHEEKGELLCPRCGFNLGSISRTLTKSRHAQNHDTEFKIHASQDPNPRPARPTLSELLRRDSHVDHEPFSQTRERSDSQNIDRSFNNAALDRTGTVCSESNLRSYDNQRSVEAVRKTTHCEEEYLASLSESRLYLRDHRIVQNMTQCWERFLQIRLGPAYDSPKRPELFSKRASSALPKEFHGSTTPQNDRAVHRLSVPEASQALKNGRDRQGSYCPDCATRRPTEFSGNISTSQAGKRSVKQIQHTFDTAIEEQREKRRTTNQYPEPVNERRSSAREPQTHRPSTATEILPCNTCNNFAKETRTTTAPNRDSLAHNSLKCNTCERPSCACTQRTSKDIDATSRPYSSSTKIHNNSEKSCEKHEKNSRNSYARTSHNPAEISSEEKVQQWMEKNDNLGTSPRSQEKGQNNVVGHTVPEEPDHSAENDPKDGLTIIQLGTSFNLASGEKLPDESLHDQSYFRNVSLTSSIGFPSILPDKNAKFESKTDGPPVPPLDETEGEPSNDENRSWKWNYWWTK